ncbi:MAG: hypothetical protein KJ063_02255 [Anaerolineae bacterium]|nr:hypothetical protein [Anaerolineae bacterium]
MGSDRTRARQAQQEQARRQLAQCSLIDFACYVDREAARPEVEDSFIQNRYRAAHLQMIARYIERAMDGSLWDGVSGDGKKVLLITTPPGHWKSSLVSRKFPPFYIGRNHLLGRPHQVILTSYNASLAEANNRACLELVRDNPLYRNVFPDVVVSRSSQGVAEWSLEGESFPACVAGGVGGGLTGKHGVVVVDDPIRDRAQANSVPYVQTLWEWWVDVVRTRPHSQHEFILGIWTRWTENDPAGRLLRERAEGKNDERIVYLRLPALAETAAERLSVAKMGMPVDEQDPLGREPGEALWPEEEPAAAHESTRRSFPVTFDSLYQGRPRPRGGYMVGQTQFKSLPSVPTQDIRLVLGVDWAYTEKQMASPKKKEPDYTAAALVGLWTPGRGDEARLVIGYLARIQGNQYQARQFVKENMQAVGKRVPMRSAQDGIDRLFLSLMRGDSDLLGYSMKNLPHLKGDKVTKAAPWLEMAQAGLVYVVEAPWNNDFFAEVESFPNGVHDDLEDAISVAVWSLGLGQRERKARSSSKVKFYG